MLRSSVVFVAPQIIEVIAEPLPKGRAGQLLVQSELSAISAGTELLFYRGQAPLDVAVDASLAALGQEPPRYPLRYGYACLGRVIETGRRTPPEWQGQRVFAFHPHTSHFWADPAGLLRVPEGLTGEQAILLPNMETAVNLVMDGQPGLGEVVAVVGLGIVGLLTLVLLRMFPLQSLVAVDPFPLRRSLALELGADDAVWLDDGQLPPQWPAADLSYELSGNPAALNSALRLTGFAGRVVIGSWYGQKRAEINLGGAFHRSRIRLLASQVSTIDPQWSGRWSKERRFALAWRMLQRLPAQRLISHRFSIQDAAAAYQLLDRRPQDALQAILTYGASSR